MDTFIRLYDPAIDWTPQTGTPSETWPHMRDEASLVLKPGRVPLRFHCVRLTRKAYAWAMAAGDEFERVYRAFRAGVRRVDGRPDGPWVPARTDALDYVAMTEAEADEWGVADHQEIGGLVLERSVLPFDCAGGYSVRPSSRLVWAAYQRASLSAELSQARQAATQSTPAEAPAASEG